MKRIPLTAMLATALAVACGMLPDPSPTPEALALVGRWEGYLHGQALHIRVEPAGLGGMQLDPDGWGSSIMRGDS